MPTHLLSIDDLDNDQLTQLFEEAEMLEKNGVSGKELDGYVIAHLFFEPSTRTRLSFESAALRLGAKTLSVAEASSTSVAKGETLSDTIRVTHYYADAIIIRHKEPGSAQEAASVSKVPIINGGDGSNEHPTQTIVDIYTIRRRLGSIEGMKVAMTGDLKYGRTARSLSLALARFGVEMVWSAPDGFQMSEETEKKVVALGGTVTRVSNVAEVVGDIDVLYVTRPQAERFDAGENSTAEIINAELLKKAKPHLVLLHPLPRTYELATDVDNTSHAAFFDQVEYSVSVRMSILMRCLRGTTPAFHSSAQPLK